MSRASLVDSFVFSASRYVLLALSLIRNVVVAKILGPGEYGFWVIVAVIIAYGDQIHLGLRHAGDKEIPSELYQGNSQTVNRMSNTLFGGIVGLSLSAILVASGYASFRLVDSPQLRLSVLIAAGIVGFEQVNKYYLMLFRSHKEFRKSSKVEVGAELIRTVLVCILALHFMLYGALAGLLLASVLMTGYFVVAFWGKTVPLIDFTMLKHLFHIGFWLFGSGLLLIVFTNLDRVFASWWLTKRELGLYGLAALVAQLPFNLAQAITTVFYPRFSERSHRVDAMELLHDTFSKVFRVLNWTTALYVAIVVCFSDVLIRLFLPEFRESTPIIYGLAFGMICFALVPFPLGLLLATGKKKLYMTAQVLGLLLATAAFTILVAFWGGIQSIVTAANTAYFLFAFVLLCSLYWSSSSARSTLVQTFGSAFVPAITLSVIIVLQYIILPRELVEISGRSYLWVFVRLTIVLIVYLPVMLFVNRDLHLVSVAKSLIVKYG